MAVDRIRVMISSRNRDYDTADGACFPLSQLRKPLQAEINTAELFGQSLFECWINEVEPSKAGTHDLWDVCMHEVRRAHIVIALYNGDAGWAREANDIGIWHAELETSLLSGRDRTHLIQLPLSKAPTPRDKRFQRFVERELAFSGVPAGNKDDAAINIRNTLVEARARRVKRRPAHNAARQAASVSRQDRRGGTKPRRCLGASKH